MYCNRCGTSIEPTAGCWLCGTPGSSEKVVVLTQEKEYKWGKIQGRLLILLGLIRIVGPLGTIAMAVTLGDIILGISILRRNRLILPLMAGLVIVQTMSLLTLHQTRPDRYHMDLVSVVVWSVFFGYYYKRKSEFVSWL